MNVSKATQLANEKMSLHGLTQLGWKFQLDNSVRRFGVCRYRTKTISMSKNLIMLNDEVEVLDTILHEIAHALAGNAAGHGWLWKTKCIEIGAKPVRCYSTLTVEQPKMRYQSECTCGRLHQKAKRPNQSAFAWYTCKYSKKRLVFVDTKTNLVVC